MELWMNMIGEYGFPIAVTFYLLYRIEKKLDQLNQSVIHLSKLLQLNSIKVPLSHPSSHHDMNPTLKEKTNKAK
ncbi:YvrJ family protein [Evansella sp. AB-P1]|uniref:YvrJ family protein n=1 Tax=Evansella sp. AB-P1 TaxID=3037653 RepID=UPI00241F8707|nr:YvrJ family protein [Evansella sp. AB-P1]MDG5789217.1 YvrJ family protein [Evansella sp. AB-P1]